VAQWINAMRRAGFMVGVVSDSWFVAAEIVRRRVFADFALAHTLQFDGEVCTGSVHLNPAFAPLAVGAAPALCKGHVIRRLRDDRAEPRVQEVWALGDNLNDLGMLREADRAFVIEPKSPHLVREADATLVGSFGDLMLHVPAPGAAAAEGVASGSSTAR
jgi:phosphoserine phosphatase